MIIDTFGKPATGTAINESGEVVGYFTQDIPGPYGYCPKAFIYSAGQTTALESPGVCSQAKDINESGQVAGDIIPPDAGLLPDYRCALWSGIFTDLGTLAGYPCSAR